MPKPIDPKTLRSVLIVRLSAIGDVIHALPVLAALRKALPEARLGWIVEELSAPLLQHHPDLDKVYVIPKKRWKKDFRRLFRSEIQPYFRTVKADGWDAAVDLQGLSKSGLVAWASGARVRVGYGDKDGREINKLFTNRKVSPPASARHVVERNLSLLRGLGIEPDMAAAGRLGILDEERRAIGEKLKAEGWDGATPLLALNPGAGWSSKRWPPENFAEAAAPICEGGAFAPVILWGPGEEALRDAVAERLRALEIAPIVAPRTSVRELAVLISICGLFLGGDTGPTHLAGLLGVPVVSIFGASDGHRNRPWPVAAGPIIQQEHLPCVPCWKTVCPLAAEENLRCLRTLEPLQVTEAAREAISRGPQKSL
ncbi:MAG: glycosyltransferase family 9 protein [Sumerlaeia bacterium]